MTEIPPDATEPRSTPSHDDELLEAARRRAAELQGLYIHLMVYAVINAGLFVINALTRGDGSWWFYWPLLGWGIALLIHVATVNVGVFSEDWKEHKARQILERGGHGHASA